MDTMDPRNELMLKGGNACQTISRFGSLPLDEVLEGLAERMARKTATPAVPMEHVNALRTVARFAGIDFQTVVAVLRKEVNETPAQHQAWRQQAAA
jgi:hypothetical protein